jgi:RNA polymerase sigma-70 factor (ECF subfamily)
MSQSLRQGEREAALDRADIEAFRRRDPHGVHAMYRRYGRLVYGVARRVLDRHDLAEEATQQTFLRAWQAADRLDPDRDPGGWLATIAKRTAIDVYRYESRRAAISMNDIAPHDRSIVTLPPDLDAVDTVWHVRQAIDALDEDEADVVRLQHLERMTHAEIADKLGIPVGTVKSRSHRAHRKLATLLGHLRETVA